MQCPVCNEKLWIYKSKDKFHYCKSIRLDHYFHYYYNDTWSLTITEDHECNFLKESVELISATSYMFYVKSPTLGIIRIAKFKPEEYKLVLDRFCKVNSFI